MNAKVTRTHRQDMMIARFAPCCEGPSWWSTTIWHLEKFRSSEIPFVNNHYIPMDLMYCSRLAYRPIQRRCLGVYRLAVDHAGIIHEHHCPPFPVDSDCVEADAPDETADFRNGRLALVDRLGAVDADDFEAPPSPCFTPFPVVISPPASPSPARRSCARSCGACLCTLAPRKPRSSSARIRPA